MIFAAPTRARDGTETFDSTAGELSDAAGLEPFIAEKRKRVPQARCQRRKGRGGVWRVLVQEVQTQTHRQPAFTVERNKGVVHRVRVLACDSRSMIFRVKRARILVGRDTESRIVLQ